MRAITKEKLDAIEVRMQRALGLRGSLHDFVKMAWHIVEPATPFIDNWHIHRICEALEKVSKREIRKLIVNVPPGSMKSLLVCVFWPVWDWLRNPSRRWMFSSFDNMLTRRDAERSFKLMRSEWFRTRWPLVSVPPDAAMGTYQNTLGGWRMATSVGGKTTGNHPDMIVIDDPTKPLEATVDNLKKTQAWWKSTMVNRGDQKKVCRVLIMQRLHEEDLSEYLRKNEKGWTVLSFPMEYEPKNACEEDPRTEVGELLCPVRWGPDEVAELKINSGPQNYAAQYQQTPTPEAGLLFKHKHFARRWVQGVDVPEYPETFFSLSCMSWDFTFKDKKDSDFVVGQAWGKANGKFYLLDTIRRRMSFTESKAALLEFRRRWPWIHAILIEDKANGTAIEDELNKDVPGIILVEPRGSKSARAQAVGPYFEAGNVIVPADGEQWVTDYVSELTRFPMGSNDDQVDATSQALDYLAIQSYDLGKFSENMQGMMEALAG